MLFSQFNDFSDSPTIFFPPQQHSYDHISIVSPLQPYQSKQFTRHCSQWTPPGFTASIKTNPSTKRSRDSDDDDDNEQASIPANMNIPGDSFNSVPATTGALTSEMLSQRPTVSDYNAWYSGVDLPGTLHLQAPLDPEKSLYDSRRKFSRRKSPPTSTMVATNHPLATPMAVPYDNSPGQGIELIGTGWSRFFTNPAHNFPVNYDTEYIEDHYPLSGVKIMMESKAGKALIVETKDQGYWLLPYSLSEARLVGLSWRTALDNLRSFPIQFEGLHSVRATADSASSCNEKMDMN